MNVTKFPFKPLSYLALAVALGGFGSGAFAQGVFEGSGEEDNGNCVGDGCGIEFPAQEQPAEEQATSAQEDSAATQADSAAVQGNSAVASADTSKTTDYFDDEDSRPTFVNETSADYRARKEGFSKSIQFGFRVGGGVSLNLIGSHTDGWNPGVDIEGGAIAKLPLGNDFLAAAGLDFSYRTYSYEADTDYGKNEADLTEMLFEIPVFAQYNFDEDGFFAGIGFNIGLKMQGETEFRQTIDTKEKHYKDKRNNTMPTVGVELGGLLDLGYVINKHFVVDLRLVQNITNLLNLDVIAESTLMKTELLTSHATLGITYRL